MQNQSKYSDVPVRIRSWLIIIPIFLLGILNAYTISLFVTFLLFWSQKEYVAIFKIKSKILSILIPVLLVAQLLCFIWQLQYYYFSISIAMLIAHVCFGCIHIVSTKRLLYMVGLTVILLSLPFLVMIRDVNYINDRVIGFLYLILLVVPTELNDVFQYLSGKLFGKHKIVPKISPNKTTEGFLGGLVMTTLLTIILATCISQGFSYRFILLGFLIGVLGFLGDIFLSYVKRKTNVKDTGNLLPGHGGLLDRIDSLLFICPVFYLFITI